MKYGAKGAKWAPISEEGSITAKPTYGEAKEFEGINEFNETLNFAEGSGYGDDREMLNIREFTNGEGTIKAVYIPTSLLQAITGVTGNDDGNAYRTDDTPALGAYGFYRTMMDTTKKKYYEVNFYPKVQGSIEGSSSKTKEDGITLEYDSVKFRIMACKHGEYKVTQRFDTESAAISYIDGLFSGTSKWPNDPETVQTA